MLEELGLKYNVHHIDFEKEEQKSAEFLKINPNGRVPAIVDHANEDLAIAESGAILLYLSDRCGGKFWPTEARAKHEAMQWLMFQASAIGPTMGDAMYYQRIAAPAGEKQPYAIARSPRDRF